MAPLAIIAGTALMAYGQVKEGQAADAQGKSEQNMAEYNAKVQEREAQAIEERTRIAQQKQAEYGSREMGTLKAGLGASGAVTTAGSPLMIQAKQASEFELDNLMMGYEGAVNAQTSRSQADMDRMSGKLARQRGKAALNASYMKAGGTALMGFGSAYGYGGAAPLKGNQYAIANQGGLSNVANSPQISKWMGAY
jgi:hypothetical protein